MTKIPASNSTRLSIFTRAPDRPRNSCWRRADGHTIGREPCSQRYDEFVRIAAEAKAERERKKALRKRATIARRAIRVRRLNAVQKSIDTNAFCGHVAGAGAVASRAVFQRV